MFPFNMQSLTQSIDKEIHRAVRQKDPKRYLAFRASEVLAKAGFLVGFGALIVYSLWAYAAGVAVDALAGHTAEMRQVCGSVVFAGLLVGVIAQITYKVLLKELQPIAMSVLSQIRAQ